MFDYTKVDWIDLLPKDLQESVQLKKEKDLEAKKTAEYKLESGLAAIKGIFKSQLSYPTDLLFAILKFMEMEGSDMIAQSEEFKEMTTIAVVKFLSDTIFDPEDLKNINLVMINVLGISIGESDFYKKIFLDQDRKRMISIWEMKEIFNVIEDVSVTKEEYLLAMEEGVNKKEGERGLSPETLEIRVFLKTEKAKIALSTEINFSEYLKLADKYLKDLQIYSAVTIYGLLKRADFPLEEKRGRVLSEYEGSEIGTKEEAATHMAKKVKLIPYGNIIDQIIGYFR